MMLRCDGFGAGALVSDVGKRSGVQCVYPKSNGGSDVDVDFVEQSLVMIRDDQWPV